MKREKKKKDIELPPEINSNFFQIFLDLHTWIKSKKLSGGFCCLPLSWCFQQLWLFFFVFFWKAWIISLPEVGLGRWTSLLLLKLSKQLTIFITLAFCRNWTFSFKLLWVENIQCCLLVPDYYPKIHWAGIILKIETVHTANYVM